jgi:hypothetical protein
MSAERELDRIVRSWLREDEHDSADDVLQSVLARLDTATQRRSIWPVRRFNEMSASARIVAVAAVVALAHSGGAVKLGGGRGPQATPGPSQAPSAAPPSESAAASTAPLPGEFSACVPSYTELKTGTDTSEVVAGTTIDHRRGFTWKGTITATDPRFSGSHFYSFDANNYKLASGGDAQVGWAEGHRIENDQGAWQGWAVGASMPGGLQQGSPAILKGEGAYSGLNVVLFNVDGPCFFDYLGIVMDVPDPPVPATGS